MTTILEEQASNLQKILRDNMLPAAEGTLGEVEVRAMIGFFKCIQEQGGWRPPRNTDELPLEFIQQWNALNLVGRDEIAKRIANEASEQLRVAVQTAADRSFRQLLFKKMVTETLDTTSTVVGAAAASVAETVRQAVRMTWVTAALALGRRSLFGQHAAGALAAEAGA